jgi:hypothetical protein
MRFIDDTNAPKGKPQKVNIYDPKDDTTTPMPARELAPFMMKTTAIGGGKVFVDAREMKPGKTYYHPPFTFPPLVEAVRRMQMILTEVLPMTWKEWEDGFRRDLNAADEISKWDHLARAYQEVTDARGFSLEEKKDYFRVLLGCINASPEHALKVTELETISEDEARNAIDLFIRVAP